MTTPSPFPLADADPLGAATGWLAGHPDLAVELQANATAAGRQVGAVNEPPFPRLVLTETNCDLRQFTGLSWTSINVDVYGDPGGRHGKAFLARLAIATAETLRQLREQPRVGGCVFTEVTANGGRWAPIAGTMQPRFVITATLWWRPANPGA